ncbi:hypothetical protein niasHT_027630 [Heterodera trifolii]|uniref:Uncharacterized protein n=1 Tax=Heterodera trifolii TaxID=157864 RepID=A0ABD2K5C3_9BILA
MFRPPDGYDSAVLLFLQPSSAGSSPFKLFVRPSVVVFPVVAPPGECHRLSPLAEDKQQTQRTTPPPLPMALSLWTKIVPRSVRCPCVFLSPGDGAAAVGTGWGGDALQAHVFGMDRFSKIHPPSTGTTGRMGREAMVNDGRSFSHLRKANGLLPEVLSYFWVHPLKSPSEAAG